MTKHLRLLDTLRQSSAGLKQIAGVIDQAVTDIQKIEELGLTGIAGNPDSDVIMAELGDTIDKIQRDREIVEGSVTELPTPREKE